MNYFEGVAFSQLKQRYRKLAQSMHPDRGGDTNAFQEMQRQFEYLINGKDPFIKKEEKREQKNTNQSTIREYRFTISMERYLELNSIMLEIPIVKDSMYQIDLKYRPTGGKYKIKRRGVHVANLVIQYETFAIHVRLIERYDSDIVNIIEGEIYSKDGTLLGNSYFDYDEYKSVPDRLKHLFISNHVTTRLKILKKYEKYFDRGDFAKMDCTQYLVQYSKPIKFFGRMTYKIKRYFSRIMNS